MTEPYYCRGAAEMVRYNNFLGNREFEVLYKGLN